MGVDNSVYETLGDRWYTAQDDPIALLRAESRARNPWIASVLKERALAPEDGGAARVLDVGCGAGFLSNDLAKRGFRVSAIDASASSLEVARRHDTSGTVDYRAGDALSLPFADGAFEAVCAMDFLEHVADPCAVIRECARVLRPGGLFFFHTFNRTWIAGLVVIRGVEWFVRNTPPRLHELASFIRPDELKGYCTSAGLQIREIFGFGPRVAHRAFWRMLRTGCVEDDFTFERKRSIAMGYSGFAVLQEHGIPRRGLSDVG